MGEPLLVLRDLRRNFPAPEGADPLVVLRGIDLELDVGESLAIVGPSGSGKSTLLHLIGGLDRPSSGSVRVGGRELGALDADSLARLRGREIGFVFQAHYLLPQLGVLENALVPSLVLEDRELRAQAPARARALLERVGLGARLAHKPAQLSGGECQRVALVRALVNRPRLLVADEPTGSLDAASARALADLLCELNREERVALVVVTHSEALAERMGRVLRIADGRLVEAAARA